MIAHVGGAPLEETLLPLLSAGVALLFVAQAWVLTHLGSTRPRPAQPVGEMASSATSSARS